MQWENNLSKLLGVRYPIIQAPMFGVTTPQMVAAANQAKALGNLALADLPADECVALIRATKALTQQPFAVNIFVNAIPPLTNELKVQYAHTKQQVEQLAKQHHLEVKLPDINDIKLTNYRDQLDAIIAEGCKLLSFTFGNLDSQSIQKLKQNGVILIGTCTSVSEAIQLEQAGIDLICVQGIEAGGHRGSFTDDDIPQIGGLSLLSQVFDTVKVPLIYAGGIYNAATLWAAKTLGAQGFQIGSLLLGSQESALLNFEKQRLRQANESDIMLTKSFSGRYARGLRNAFIQAMEYSDWVLPYPYQNKLTGELRKVARANRNADFVNIWVGQSVNDYQESSTTEIIQQLITATENFRP